MVYFFDLSPDLQQMLIAAVDSTTALRLSRSSKALRVLVHNNVTRLDLKHLKSSAFLNRIGEICSSFPNLRSLQCGRISLNSLLTLSKSNIPLVELHCSFRDIFSSSKTTQSLSTLSVGFMFPKLQTFVARSFNLEKETALISAFLSPSLTSLSLDRTVIGKHSDDAEKMIFTHIVQNLSSLTFLSFFGPATNATPDVALYPYLLSKLPLLKSLSVAFPIDTAWSQLSDSPLALEEIRFPARPFEMYREQARFTAFEVLLKNSPKLRVLEVESEEILPADIGLALGTTPIGNFYNFCPTLEVLKFNDETFGDQEFMDAVKHLPHLREIAVMSMISMEQFQALISNFPRLELLKVNLSDATSCPACLAMASCPQLHTLWTFSDFVCDQTHYLTLRPYQRSRLRDLFPGEESTVVVLDDKLPHFPALTELNDDRFQAPFDLARISRHFPALKNLVLSQYVVNGRRPVSFPNLRSLTRTVADDGDDDEFDLFRLLALCPNLVELTYEFNEYSPLSVSDLTRIPTLLPRLRFLRITSSERPKDDATNMLLSFLANTRLQEISLRVPLLFTASPKLEAAFASACHLRVLRLQVQEKPKKKQGKHGKQKPVKKQSEDAEEICNYVEERVTAYGSLVEIEYE